MSTFQRRYVTFKAPRVKASLFSLLTRERNERTVVANIESLLTSSLVMNAQTIAQACVHVQAPRHSVWRLLVEPQTVTKIMPVNEVVHAWQEGAPFLWKVHMLDSDFEVSGRVVCMKAPDALEYDYCDPHELAFSGRETWHHVTIRLTETFEGTSVSVTQDNNTSDAAHQHAEGGWRLALWNLKALVEGGPEACPR